MLETGLIHHWSNRHWQTRMKQPPTMPTIDPVSISDVAMLFIFVFCAGMAVATVTLVIECILHCTSSRLVKAKSWSSPPGVDDFSLSVSCGSGSE